jgi:hypothetical protein
MKTYKTTGTLSEKGYRHFGIHPMTAVLYGDKEEDILDLEFIVSDNQERPLPNDKKYIEDSDYWAWFDSDGSTSLLIYPQYFLLNMCFPNGIKAREEKGRGEAKRIEFI